MDKRYGAGMAFVGVTIIASMVFALELKFALTLGIISGIAVYFLWDFMETKGIAEKKIAPEQECWDDFMKSDEKKNVERSLAVMLTDAVKSKVLRIGDNWYYFLNVGYGQQPILKLNAIADRGNRFEGFVSEREIYRLGEPEKLESLTREKKIDPGDIEQIKKLVGIKKDPLEELLKS